MGGRGGNDLQATAPSYQRKRSGFLAHGKFQVRFLTRGKVWKPKTKKWEGQSGRRVPTSKHKILNVINLASPFPWKWTGPINRKSQPSLLKTLIIRLRTETTIDR